MVVSSDTSKWYVVHCHSGFEKKVADSIMDEAKKVELEDLINEVSVPTQAVVEVRRGVRVNSEKKFFSAGKISCCKQKTHSTLNFFSKNSIP